MEFNAKLINSIRNILISSKETVSVAESVTSGFVQAALSQAKEASNIFHGGITVYNIGQKCRHLHIDPIHAEGCNCVSATVAEQMSLGVSTMFSSTYGLAITGYAATYPEAGINDLYAYMAISRNGKIIAKKKVAPTINIEDAKEVQLFYTNELLRLFLSSLKNKPDGKPKKR